MPAIDVVADANVVLKWFHTEGEPEVESARALLTLHGQLQVCLHVLDLTPYELGNALLGGQAKAGGRRTAVVLDALSQICPTIAATTGDLRYGCELAERHDLTVYDATYAAVAERREAQLATFDARL